jgi:thiamine-monophosphate kinase
MARKKPGGAQPPAGRLSERAIIARIMQRFAKPDPDVLVGLGDDAAQVRLNFHARPGGLSQIHLLTAADMLVEGSHFDRRYVSLADAGYKALAVNVSDIAAMGGAPHSALASVGVPPDAREADIEELLDGLEAAAQDFHVRLVGGDTVVAPQWVLAVSVTGESRERALRRHGAQPGDVLWHSGALGLSQTGLHLLWGGLPAPAAARQAHLRPRPPVELGLFLQETGLATACLDLSDTLSQCAVLLAEASGVGLRLDFTDYPFAPEVLAFAQTYRRKTRPGFAIPAALDPGGGGPSYVWLAEYLLECAEDYQLLFTTPPDAAPALARFTERTGCAITRLGQALPPAEGMAYVAEDGAVLPLEPCGFEHLGPR